MPELPSIQFRETFLTTTDGVRLRVREPEFDGTPRAELIITHGLGEHCRRYEHVAAALAEIRVRAWLYDLRGHGKSGGRKGDARRYGLFLEDLETVRRMVSRASSEGLFLLGHSFGGQITARYLEEQRPDVLGAVILSPWLRLAFQPDKWRIALARLCLWLCPGWAHHNPAMPEKLSRDLKYLMGLPDAELMHRRLTPRLYFEITSAGVTTLEHAKEIDVPLLLIHGDADTVTCSKATELLYERVTSSDKTLRVVPEALHETHNDLCRQEVLGAVCDWVSARL